MVLCTMGWIARLMYCLLCIYTGVSVFGPEARRLMWFRK